MSVTLENQLSWFKDLSIRLRGTAVQGVCGQRENRNLWHDAVLLWAAMLYDIRDRSDDFRREEMTLTLLYEQGEVSLAAMKVLLLRLRRYYRWPGTRYRSFKRSILHDIPGIQPVVHLLDGNLRNFFRNPSATTFRPLNDLLSFMSRLSLKSEGLETAAITSFRCSDDIIVTATEDELAAVEATITEWIGAFVPDTSYGFHGPGASATLSRRDAYPDAKYRLLFTTQLMEYIGCTGQAIQHADSYPPAEIVFVPKSFDSLRTICKIPAGLMYFQQAVQRQLYAFIENSDLRRHLCFSDQSASRTLAVRGSRDDTYYTVDLSAASDTVSWDVVKRVFRRVPLGRFLRATRTREYQLPDGTSLVPNKYDPMGSACTFPVESLLFAAICEITSVCKKPRYRVYGDDIVCHPLDVPSDQLIARLQRFGFKVNTEKSYLTGPFREACGVEAYNGEDVSPVRLSRSFRSLHVSPDNLARLRELANAFAWRGYQTARLLVLRRVLNSKYSNSIAFSMSGEHGTWQSFSATNYRLTTRRNLALQRTEFPEIQVLQRRSRGDEANRYVDWNSQRYHEAVVLPTITGREWTPSLPLQELSGGGRLFEKVRVVWRPTELLD